MHIGLCSMERVIQALNIVLGGNQVRPRAAITDLAAVVCSARAIC